VECLTERAAQRHLLARQQTRAAHTGHVLARLSYRQAFPACLRLQAAASTGTGSWSWTSSDCGRRGRRRPCPPGATGPRGHGQHERQALPRRHFRTHSRIAAALGLHPKAITAAPDGVRPDAGMDEITATPPGALASGPSPTCTRTFPAPADQVRQARAFLARRGTLSVK
jgi:hypothetical protein